MTPDKALLRECHNFIAENCTHKFVPAPNSCPACNLLLRIKAALAQADAPAEHCSTCGSLNRDIPLLVVKGELSYWCSDWRHKQNAFNDQIDAAVSGLTGDVKSLQDQIAALQASQGAISPEDQALLDGIQTRSQAVADKLTALDSLTPPVPPAA